jgi:predicted RNase H-like nuclease (RuvC/YqgF family)
MTETEKLEKELAETKKKLKELKKQEKKSKRNLAIRDLSEVTALDKIKFFDMMYNSSLEELKQLEKEHYHDEDAEHYAWEASIEILAKDHTAFWEYWNSFAIKL